MRAWKNTSGLAMSGLLLDTLVYNYLNEKTEYRSTGYSNYDVMSRDFFQYLKEQDKQEYYAALGSRQRVYVKHPFKTKAANALKLANKAIAETNDETRHDNWRELFGRAFPKYNNSMVSEARSVYSAMSPYTDPEQFIEDRYPLNITEELSINCRVTEDGFRPTLLRDMLRRLERIRTRRSLDFYIEKTTVKGDYEVLWKVRNVGPEAIRKRCLRGELYKSNKANNIRHESSNFFGPHYVECYIIQNGKVVARDRIDVPIRN